jgi:SsrA-binding protein
MSATSKKKTPRVQISNKRASFDYEFLEQYDAGIVLVGTEIKSLRAGKASLQDAWCYFSGGELYVRGMNISTYFWASKWGSHEPARDRKLLLTRRELRHLQQAVKNKGLTIVAVRAFISEGGYAKLHIALARGKKEFDKRATIREKDIRREMERE